MPMHGWWGSGWGAWEWIAMSLFWLVPLLLAVGLLWLILGGRGRGDGAGAPGDAGDDRRALAILKERYARGEISREEFERMKKDILS